MLYAVAVWLFAAHVWPCVSGHGRLIEPPSRASAWRYGFSTPPNYNDHELYCGGFSRQWQRNGGKCGICGDAWDMPTPRPHEIGGVYGQGLIVRRYAPPDSIINIRIQLTANHNGRFEFRLCPDYKNTTQECLDKYLLRLAKKQDDSNISQFYPRDGNKIYEIKYRLPNIKCNHCVLQWKYIAGNNWGDCPNGTGAVGCGPQEEFRACADIAIDSVATTPTLVPVPTTTEIPTLPHTEYHLTSLITTALSLLCILLFLALLYIYYYQVGKNVKACLQGGNKDKNKEAAPVPPPRTKKNRKDYELDDDNMQTISLDFESLA